MRAVLGDRVMVRSPLVRSDMQTVAPGVVTRVYEDGAANVMAFVDCIGVVNVLRVPMFYAEDAANAANVGTCGWRMSEIRE